MRNVHSPSGSSSKLFPPCRSLNVRDVHNVDVLRESNELRVPPTRWPKGILHSDAPVVPVDVIGINALDETCPLQDRLNRHNLLPVCSTALRHLLVFQPLEHPRERVLWARV